MLIDWFTVGAQALNFVVLVWLLGRFLYRPIVNAIDAREKRIASELADAAAKQAAANTARDEFTHKNAESEKQRAELLQKATTDAGIEHQRLLDEARKAADTLSAKRTESLRNDAHNLDQAIGQRVQQEVFAVARKALADLAGASLEERCAETFAARLRAMEGQAKSDLALALKTSSAPALIRSAFELSAEQRAMLQKAINETFSAAIRLRFETAAELVGGVELSANGIKVSWNIAGYLTALELSVDAILKERTLAAKSPTGASADEHAK